MATVNVIPTPEARHVAEGLEKIDGIHVLMPEKHHTHGYKFRNGDPYHRVPGLGQVEGPCVILSSSEFGDANQALRVQQAAYAIEDVRGKNKWLGQTIAFPLDYPFARQDRVFETGEVAAAKWFTDSLFAKPHQVSRIIGLDVHFDDPGSTDAWHRTAYYAARMQMETAVPFLIAAVREKHGDEVIPLSPDAGGYRRTGLPQAFHKNRLPGGKTTYTPIDNLDNLVSGKRVVLVDDMIDSGGTTRDEGELLRNAGASFVVAAATHLIQAKGYTEARKTCDDVIVTNTIRHEGVPAIDATALIGNIIKKYA